MALVVHSDLGVLSAYQAALTQQGYVTIICRDLPSSLLAITQHFFEIAVVSSKLDQRGDGWPLAGILHLVFPKAFIAVISPDADIRTLQMAINNGVSELYEPQIEATQIVKSIVEQMGARSAPRPGRVQ